MQKDKRPQDASARQPSNLKMIRIRAARSRQLLISRPMQISTKTGVVHALLSLVLTFSKR
jgi:hypothetical protein